MRAHAARHGGAALQLLLLLQLLSDGPSEAASDGPGPVLELDCANTLQALAGLIRRYLGYFAGTGFIQALAQPQDTEEETA